MNDDVGVDLPQSPSWHRGQSFNSSIGHIYMLHDEGVLVVPDFQRGLVWTRDQKIKFLESVMLNLPIGEYCLHKSSDLLTYEILDGQQRINALLSFRDNEFPALGVYYRDLNGKGRRALTLWRTFPLLEVSGLSYEAKLEAYNRLAYGGTPHEVAARNESSSSE